MICFSARAYFSHKRNCDFDHDGHVSPSPPIGLNNPGVACNAPCPVPDISTFPDLPPVNATAYAESNHEGE